MILDADGSPARLDRDATQAFLRYAESNPRRALFGAAARQVARIERVVDSSDAGADTRVPDTDSRTAGAQTVEEYLSAAEADVEPIWPSLARRLREVREGTRVTTRAAA